MCCYVDMLREIGDKVNTVVRSAERNGQALKRLATEESMALMTLGKDRKRA